MRNFTYLAVFIIASFTLASCSSSSDSTSPNPVQSISEKSIGPEGGVINSMNGLLSLAIPAGALAESSMVSIELFESAAEDVLLYELLPAGLEFAVPATMTVDLTNLMSDSNASALSIANAPVILSSNRDLSGIEILNNHTLVIDADSETFSLSAHVSHFSTFLVGGNMNARASLEGVPQFAQANTPIDTVKLMLDTAQFANNLSSVVYNDGSTGSVVFNGQRPTDISPIGPENKIYSFDLPYACGDPQLGMFKADVRFNFESTEIVVDVTPEQFDIGAVFFQPFWGEHFIEGRTTVYYRNVTSGYTLHAKRSIECNAPIVVVDPISPPLISVSSVFVELLHTIGQTECPTFSDPINVFSDSPNPTTLTIAEDLPFLNIDISDSNTKEGGFTLNPSFPCSDFNIGDNPGTITLTVTDTVTGLTSEPKLIDFNVKVM